MRPASFLLAAVLCLSPDSGAQELDYVVSLADPVEKIVRVELDPAASEEYARGLVD